MVLPEASRRPKFTSLLLVIVWLYVFLLGIKLMGGGCNAAQDCPFVKRLILETKDPFIAFFVGLLVTSIIQSSSVTTSIIVVLVSSTPLTVRAAVPIVIGAHIGTTVTNLIVSMGYVTRRDEFRRAITGAVVHALFNVLTVLVMLPIELCFHPLERAAFWLTGFLPKAGSTGAASSVNLGSFDPVGAMLQPAAWLIRQLIGDPAAAVWVAGFTVLVGLVLLFVALLMLVKVLRSLTLGRAESSIGKAIGKSGWLGILIGFVVTAIIQSSSVTTSVLVPMAAAGIITVAQLLPITIGANIGTTVTALIASFAASKAKGLDCVTIAFVHTLFSVSGLLIFYPTPAIRRIPLWLAAKFGTFAAESRALAIACLIALFYGIPGLFIVIYRFLL